jgi:hypothetical protein
MPRHRRVPIEPIAFALSQREQVAEALEPTHRRLADDERHPPFEQFRCDVDGAADRANMRRGIEGRADLVLNDGRGERLQQLEDWR